MFRVLVFSRGSFLQIDFPPRIKNENMHRTVPKPLPVDLRPVPDPGDPVVFIDYFQDFMFGRMGASVFPAFWFNTKIKSNFEY